MCLEKISLRCESLPYPLAASRQFRNRSVNFASSGINEMAFDIARRGRGVIFDITLVLLNICSEAACNVALELCDESCMNY